MEGFQPPPALGPRYLPAKITVRDSTTPPLPTPSPATSHPTPVLQNSLRSGNGKKKLLQGSTVEWVFRGRKGCGSAAKHKGPAPGCGCGTQCLQSTRLRAQGHRRAGTHSSSTRPRSPKAQSGRTLTEVGGHQPADLATAFRPALGPESGPGRPFRTPSSGPHSPLYTPIERGHAAATATADPAVCFPPVGDPGPPARWAPPRVT